MFATSRSGCFVLVSDVTEDEIPDVGEHDGGLVVGCHVTGVEDVVIGEITLVGLVSFGWDDGEEGLGEERGRDGERGEIVSRK